MPCSQSCCARVYAQIGKGALYPSVAPGSILLRHRTTKAATSLAVWASSKFSRRTPIVFLGDQFSMLRQQCFWCNDGSTPPRAVFDRASSLCGQSTPLIVTKPQPLTPDLFSQNAILLHQIFDNLLLMAVYPPGNRGHNKGKWVQGRVHRRILWTTFRTISTQSSQ